MRFCVECGSTGPFYERLRRSPERLEFSTRCKACYKAQQRERRATNAPARRDPEEVFRNTAELFRQELDAYRIRRGL